LGERPTMEADGTRTHKLTRSWRTLRGIWKRETKKAFLRRTLRQVLPTRYRAWIGRHEPSPADLLHQRTAAEALGGRPSIAVVVSLHTPQDWLDASDTSVMEQSYHRWTLVPVAEPHQPADVTRWPHDARIIVPSPQHREGADVILALRPGDSLAPHALFEIAALVNRDPDAELVYCDEDRISEDGRTPHSPIFKPDWSPEMALSVNYLEPAAVRRSLLDRLGAAGADLLGPTARDVLLRCAEHARGIRHIPKVLCHRRAPSRTSGEDDLRAV